MRPDEMMNLPGCVALAIGLVLYLWATHNSNKRPKRMRK